MYTVSCVDLLVSDLSLARLVRHILSIQSMPEQTDSMLRFTLLPSGLISIKSVQSLSSETHSKNLAIACLDTVV